MRFLICKNMVYKDKKYISIKVNPRFDYDIRLDEIKCEGIDTWLKHLRQKNWFTPGVEVEFIETYYGKIKSS